MCMRQHYEICSVNSSPKASYLRLDILIMKSLGCEKDSHSGTMKYKQRKGHHQNKVKKWREHKNCLFFFALNNFCRQVQPHLNSPYLNFQPVWMLHLFNKFNSDVLLFALKNHLGRQRKASICGYTAHFPRFGPASQVAAVFSHFPHGKSSQLHKSLHREGSGHYTAKIVGKSLNRNFLMFS